MMTRQFIPGLELAGHFYQESVRPILERRFPQLIYSAARIDFGSDVLGFDTPRSMDHDWGPKLTLFVSEADHGACADALVDALAWELPFVVRGYPTHFDGHPDGTRLMQSIDRYPVQHGVTVTTPGRFFRTYLGVDPAAPLREVDWLAIPQQRLRTIASGRVFHDSLGQLESARQMLHWYPHDVWLYLLANQWRRIDQEEPFMARCGDVGDEPGSRLIAARLVGELMRLCFLMERQYAPYSKWFGTAFARLSCASNLTPIFAQVFGAANWREREQHLSQAYVIVARMHNALRVTPLLEPQVSPFHDRPYLVLHSDRFVEALHAVIQSHFVRAWPRHLGAVGQFVDSTDVLDSPERCRQLAVLYEQSGA
jgi:hypothetical protein